MATYYADLDITGSGGDGSIGDPWQSAAFLLQTTAMLDNGDVIKVKGQHDYTLEGGFEIASQYEGSITIENWDSTGWRIRAISINVSAGSILRNGIISTKLEDLDSSIGILNGRVYDCHLEALDIYLSDPSNVVKGCTLKASVGLHFNSFNCDLKDTIIDAPSITDSENIVTDNCCFTSALPSGTHTDAQANWTPPTWPAWNDPQGSFSNSILGVGITTPPNPGNTPYTDYASGLFGSTRSGIGAFYFTAVPVAIGDRYIAKVTAYGWIKDHIYEWDGTQWTDTPPAEGACVVIKQLFDTYTFLNGSWVENDVPWLDPIIEIYDNTTALPAVPANGDRYIALVTANTWTINGVYEWNGNNWVETLPVAGMLVFNNDTAEPLLYSGSAWVPFGSLSAHAIGGPLHTASSVTDIKTKVSGPDFLLTSQPAEIGALPQKDYSHFEDHLVLEDYEDSRKKKRIDIGKMTPWLYGSGSPPSTTGLVDGTLYIKYTP